MSPVHWASDMFWMHRSYELSNRLNDNPDDRAGRRALKRMMSSRSLKLREGGLWVFQELVECPTDVMELVYDALDDPHLMNRWYAIQGIANNPRMHPTYVLQAAVDASEVFRRIEEERGKSTGWINNMINPIKRELLRRSK